MRIWEFEDNKAIPSDLVREQDFILRVRRLQRLGTPHLVINLVLNAVHTLNQNRRALEAAQGQLQEFAKTTSGFYADMSNGDAFIIWEESDDTHLLAARLLAVLLPESPNLEDTSTFLKTYHMPQDYTSLRERANDYIEIVRLASTTPESNATRALQSDTARGPLTAWSVDQISKLLGEIDLRPYIRMQSLCRYGVDGTWTPTAEECFVSFGDLRRERFPKLEVITPQHLFLALCEKLDQQLLAMLTEQNNILTHSIAQSVGINLNLSVGSVTGQVFAQFCHSIPIKQRSLICFELHRGDLLQDFSETQNAIALLRQEGFKIALDGITPDIVGVLDLTAFDVDIIKINASKDRLPQLNDPVIHRNLSRLNADKIVFFRCDDEQALATGLALGVSQFQGWLIDTSLANVTQTKS